MFEMLFEMFLECGGDIGKMAALEEVVQIQNKSRTTVDGWFSRQDLLVKYAGRADKVDDLRRKEQSGGVDQDPNFPNDPAMKLFKCFEFKHEQNTETVECLKTLHWTGAVALDMAKQIEGMFHVEAPMLLVLERGGRRRHGAGSPVRGTPNPKKKVKVHNPKNWTNEWAGKAQLWRNALQDVRAKLAGKSFAKELVNQMGPLMEQLSELHDDFVKAAAELPTEPLTNDDGTVLTVSRIQAIVDEYHQILVPAREYLEASDNILSIKKRKPPAYPAEQILL